MQLFGLGWLAVELAVRDGDSRLAPLYIGLIGLSRAAPALTFTLIAGAIVDRTDRRRLLLSTQAVTMTLTATLAIITIAGLANIAVVMLCSLLIGTSSSFDGPARQSLLPRLVPKHEIMSAVGLQSFAVHGTGIIGPALAGLLIGPIGAGGLLLLNAAGYIAVLVAIAAMPPMPPVADEARPSVLGSVRQGLAYVAKDPAMRWVFVIAVGTSLLARPYLQLLPAFVANHLALGPSALSLLLSVTGVGAVIGAGLVASIGRLRRRGRLLMAAAVVTGSLVSVMGLQTDLTGAAITTFLAGVSSLVAIGALSAILQTTAPENMLGRVMSVQTMTFMGGMPLGQLVLGAFGSIVGIERVYVVAGAAAVVVALAAVRWGGALRDLGGDVAPDLVVVAPASAAE